MGLWKSFRNLGLGLKLSIALTLGMVVLLATVMVVVVFSAQNLTAQAGRGRARQEAEVVQSRFEEAEQDVLGSAKLLASRTGLAEAVVSRDEAEIRTSILLGATPFYLDDIGVMDPDGTYIMIVMGEALGSSRHDAMVLYALQGVETTNIIIEEAALGPLLVGVVPLRDESGAPIGALSVSRRIDDVFLEERNFYRDDVHLALVSGGRILTHDFPDPKILGELSGALVEEPQYESGESGEKLVVVADDLLRSSDGVPYALAHSPFAKADASVAVVVDMGELNTFRSRLARSTAMVLASLTLVVTLAVFLFARDSVTRPISKLRTAAERMASGDYQQLAEVKTRDEVGQLASAFNNMAVQLRQTLESLQHRSADLERRSIQLQASAEVARGAVSILETERLIQQVVDLIRERFNLYYVGLFLLDNAGEWVVLQAGTGEAGRAMLARDHRIKAGEGMIGWCVANGQARLAEEAEADEVRVIAEELPDTRSELALPLRSRGRVFGALTVQSDRPAAFDEPAISVLQTMADQVAVAIDNARLFAESQSALQAERRAYGQLAGQAWGDLLRTHTDWGYRYDQHTVAPVEGDWTPEMQQAEQTGRAVVSAGEDGGGAKLAVPIRVRGHTIGVLRFRKSEADETWASTEVATLETLADRMGQSLEGARLYQDTQRRAVRERLLSEVTGHIRETLDMDMVLQTAVREIGAALNVTDVEVRMSGGVTKKT